MIPARRLSRKAGSLLLCVALLPMTAAGDEVAELRAMVQQQQAQLAQLQRRVAELEARNATPAAQPLSDSAPATALPAPGSLAQGGGSTGEAQVQVYGNLRLDATYDLASRIVDVYNNDWASTVFAQPFDDSRPGGRQGQFFGTARATRLGLRGRLPSRFGALELLLEGDFNAPNQYQGELGSNGSGFRLRQAYLRLGPWLAGQTWSNYIDLRSYPDTVDFNPPGSATLLRQPQLRHTRVLAGGELAVALENPESVTWPPPAHDRGGNPGWPGDHDRYPDLTVNWTWSGPDGHLSLHGASLEYRNDHDRQRGYALGLSGSARLGSAALVGGLQGGNGVGRYMYNAVLQGATDVDGRLHLWRGWGWHLGLTQAWGGPLRSNIILAQSHFDADALADGALRAQWLGRVDEFVPNRRVDQAFVNTFWTMDDGFQIGLEYAWGRRLTFGPEQGHQRRINAVLIYEFF